MPSLIDVTLSDKFVAKELNRRTVKPGSDLIAPETSSTYDVIGKMLEGPFSRVAAHLWMLHGQNSVFHVLLVPSPPVFSPGVTKVNFDETSCVHSLEWAYGPYCFAAWYHELCALGGHFEFAKNRFFWFLLNSMKKFGQSIWAFIIIKLYGHYSASHVIWSLPHPSGQSPRG